MIKVRANFQTVPTRFRWKFSSVGLSIVGVMLVIATVFAVGASLLKIIPAQRMLQNDRIAHAEFIQQGFSSTIRHNLENGDRHGLNLILDGLISLPDVVFLELSNAESETWQRGNADLVTEMQSFPISRGDGATLKIGMAEHHLVGQVRAAFWRNVLLTLAGTILVGMVMMFLFDRVAAKELRKITKKIRGRHWLEVENPLVLRPNGGIFPEEVNSIAVALESMHSQARQGFQRLTEQAAKMKDLNHSLETAMQEQAELTYALSHFLITPINTLDMLTRELSELKLDAGDDSAETVADLKETVSRLRGQVEAVQIYAALLEDDHEVRMVDLDWVLEVVMQELAGSIAESNARIIADDLGSALVDPRTLRELLSQLLRNAILYRDQNRPLEIEIHAERDEKSKAVTLSVSDNGLGIEPVYKDDIFRLFQRLHTHSEIAGHGLGLPICRKIAERHGGTIALASEVGKGTTITVTFPGAAR